MQKFARSEAFRRERSRYSRVAHVVVHPAVGAETLQQTGHVIGAAVDVDEKQHVEQGASHAGHVWKGSHRRQTSEKLPVGVNLNRRIAARVISSFLNTE